MKLLGNIKKIAKSCWLRCIDSDTFVKHLRKKGIKVGDNVRFRYPEHTLIDMNRPTLVEFGNNIDINDYFTVLTHDFGAFVLRGKYKDFVNSSGKVKIGNNVVFGRNVTILKGVEIGDNTIVALGSIVTKSTPPNTVIAGAPARVVCTLEEYYAKRKEKQVPEALEYAASIIQQKGRTPRIEELYEEWVLFLTKEEYENNPIVKYNVDFRLDGYVDKDEFFKRPKQFGSFEDFVYAAKQYNTKN